jgi:Zn-dependent peptidase ImmA (M78 family)
MKPINPNFQRCQAVADKLLIAQSADFPMEVTSMRFSKQIIFDSLQHFSHVTQTPLYQFTNSKGMLKDGCTVALNSIYLVLYNIKESNRARINWTLAHEVGHIYLNHKKDCNTEEIEANFFASELLMPEILVRSIQHELGSIDASFLSELFQVSYQAASKKIDTLSRTKREKPTKDQKILLKRHQDFIHEAIIRKTKAKLSSRRPEIEQQHNQALLSLEASWLEK